MAPTLDVPVLLEKVVTPTWSPHVLSARNKTLGEALIKCLRYN